jgi:hypothetical protein
LLTRPQFQCRIATSLGFILIGLRLWQRGYESLQAFVSRLKRGKTGDCRIAAISRQGIERFQNLA